MTTDQYILSSILIGRALVEGVSQGHRVLSLVFILLATMTLTSFMSDAATAAVMCPVAISTAQTLAANADPFLMAVAVGSSCAFLTPISHRKNNAGLGRKTPFLNGHCYQADII